MSDDRLPLLFLCFSLVLLPCGVLAGVGEEQPLASIPPIDLGAYQADRFQAVEKVIQGKQFAKLQEALSFYEDLDHSGRWEPIPDGPLLSIGDVHGQVDQLRTLLHLFGDLGESATFFEPHEVFDLELQAALYAFQRRHGAKSDGVLGSETRRLLNVSPRQRIEQLLLNISRQQQLQAVAGERYLQVNIPEYRLRLYEQGRVLLDMKTIVGRRGRQTPIFSSTVKTLVVNPSWNIPKGIAFRDILPHWKKDKTYLSKNNFQVLAGWEIPRVVVPEAQIDPKKMYRGAEYQRLWEPPGLKNTLGRIKFQTTTNNSISLHDTNKWALFESDRRAFSSGCIRLEKPRMLADALIQVSNRWEPQQLEPLFDDMKTHKIHLKNPIELHVTYWTAWLDENRILNFAEDLYRHDLVELAQQHHEQY